MQWAEVSRLSGALCLVGTLLACAGPAQTPSATPVAAAAAPAPTPSPICAAEAPPPPRQTLPGPAVVIGGSLKRDNSAVWARMVALSGGAGAQWVVLGTASESPMESADGVVAVLARHGARAVSLPVSPMLKDPPAAQAVADPALIAQVRSASGVFFTGGAQQRIVETLQPDGKTTPLLDAIRALHARGGVVAGTSAGAAIMSRVMFRDAPSVLGVMQGQLREGLEVAYGLGFVGPSLFVDQHFLKRGRYGRMIPLMLQAGYKLGLGVDEDTAAFVHGDRVDVLGGRGALLVDLRDAKTDPSLGVFNVQHVRLTYLDRGDGYDLAAHCIRPSARKLQGQYIDPTAPNFAPEYDEVPYYPDMLADSAISQAMGLLIDGRPSEVLGLAHDPQEKPPGPRADLAFAFRLYREPDSRGWYSDANGTDEYSVWHLYLDIRPLRLNRPLYRPWTAADARAPSAVPAR